MLSRTFTILPFATSTSPLLHVRIWQDGDYHKVLNHSSILSLVVNIVSLVSCDILRQVTSQWAWFKKSKIKLNENVPSCRIWQPKDVIDMLLTSFSCMVSSGYDKNLAKDASCNLYSSWKWGLWFCKRYMYLQALHSLPWKNLMADGSFFAACREWQVSSLGHYHSLVLTDTTHRLENV